MNLLMIYQTYILKLIICILVLIKIYYITFAKLPQKEKNSFRFIYSNIMFLNIYIYIYTYVWYLSALVKNSNNEKRKDLCRERRIESGHCTLCHVYAVRASHILRDY